MALPWGAIAKVVGPAVKLAVEHHHYLTPWVACPCRDGLPLPSRGSASTSALSRLAQDSLALQPTDLLEPPSGPLSPKLRLCDFRTSVRAATWLYRQLPGWISHPLDCSALVAHTQGSRARFFAGVIQTKQATRTSHATERMAARDPSTSPSAALRASAHQDDRTRAESHQARSCKLPASRQMTSPTMSKLWNTG